MIENRERIIEIFKEYFTKENIKFSEITDEQSITNDYGLDSLDKIELAMHFENTLGLPTIDIEELDTIGDIVKHIDDLL